VQAILCSETGGSGVLRLADRPVPEPGPGEVRVKVAVSGVNPTDWKSRRGRAAGQPLAFPEVVPNQDGSGTIDAVGDGIDPARIGQRVWLWEAAWQRPGGTAQQYCVLPARQAAPLPDGVSFDVGASLGIPALTAHRCLTVADGGPDRLAPGALAGRTVLVAGGAGAVGHAAIQLANWSGAQVLATVSTPAKAELARAAGADHVFGYREPGTADQIRQVAPAGADIIVEVAPHVNADLDLSVVAGGGTVSCYANDGPSRDLTVAAWDLMWRNVRYQFTLVYTVPAAAKEHAVADVTAAAAARALPVGDAAGLPLTRFPLDRTADAHDAVERGTTGKVLIDVP
jgi:NADPH2:quinone reductase